MSQIRAIALGIVVAATILGIALPAQAPRLASAEGAGRYVLAFYYAWFDSNTWKPSIVPDMPVQPYVSADRGTITRHVDQARQAGIDSFVVSWLGTGNQTDWNLETMLSVVRGGDFRVTIDFETNSSFFRGQADVVNALRWVTSHYFPHPNWLRHEGKPVLFFWRLPAVYTSGGQSALDAWRFIRDQVDPNRSALWIAEGDNFSYLQVFDGIHPYSIAWSPNPAAQLASYAQRTRAYPGKLWVATAMPGYNDLRTGRADAFAVDRRDGDYYTTTFQGAIRSNPDWIIITSFNEWVEGTQIEPSVTYGDRYLALTRDLATQFKGSLAALPTPGSGADFDISGGHFYGQAAAAGQGYRVTDADGVPFWTTFRQLGGVPVAGYPISRRYLWNGLVTQAFQKMVFQWQQGSGRVYFVNVFDELRNAGKDQWLRDVRSTPGTLDASFDAAKDWPAIVRARQALLDANPAIRGKYFAINGAANPLDAYGLPTSSVVDNGSHYALRLQRAVIQQWKVVVPWAAAGEATVANGGDILKEAGLLPPEAAAPESAP